jgi:tetratricopeptide (TPR) repeat protein
MPSPRRALKSRGALKPSAELSRAQRLLRLGRRPEAIALLRELSKQFPDDAIIWFHLGTMLDASGKMAQAIPCYLRALRLNPRHPQQYEMCLYLCSSYRKTDRPQAARRWLKKAESFSRDTPLERTLKRLLERKRL